MFNRIPGYCCDIVNITSSYVNKEGLKTFSMSILDEYLEIINQKRYVKKI